MQDYQTKRRFHQRKEIRSGFAVRQPQRLVRMVLAGNGSVPKLADIADHEFLLAVNSQRKAKGGLAAGPDRITDAMLGPREEAAIYRQVSRELLNGTYEPSKARMVEIPKSGGGIRTLKIRSLVQRTVSAALSKALQPFWEGIFLPGSHGFRPKRGPWSALLHLESLVAAEERYVVATDDIRKAFDNVPVQTVVDLHRQYLDEPSLIDIITKTLRGNHQEHRSVGIDQGSAYSPVALNVLLHHVLDLPFSEDAANPPWIRYADNLLYLTRSVTEGLAALSNASRLLQPHDMTLKGEDGTPTDIRQGQTSILGYSISWDRNRLRYDLEKSAWKQLRITLAEAHKYPNPNQMALTAIQGWAGYHAPAFESQAESVTTRILGIAAQAAFRDITRQQVEQQIQAAIHGWECYRERWQKQHTTMVASTGITVAAAPQAADAPGQLICPRPDRLLAITATSLANSVA